MALRISPWQYKGESHGATTEPLMYRARLVCMIARQAATATNNLQVGIFFDQTRVEPWKRSRESISSRLLDLFAANQQN
jgi:hypothetical protein